MKLNLNLDLGMMLTKEQLKEIKGEGPRCTASYQEVVCSCFDNVTGYPGNPLHSGSQPEGHTLFLPPGTDDVYVDCSSACSPFGGVIRAWCDEV